MYCDKHSTFKKLLDEDGSVAIHKPNLEFLAIEMFTVAKSSAPTIFYKILKKERTKYL